MRRICKETIQGYLRWPDDGSNPVQYRCPNNEGNIRNPVPDKGRGLFRFPLSKAAPIAVRTIKEFCKNKDIFDCIEFVCFDEKTKKAYETALED